MSGAGWTAVSLHGSQIFLFVVEKHSLLSLIWPGSYKLIVAGMLKVNVHCFNMSQVVLGAMQWAF